ncbi:M16 family metallopeptidase [Candidatus Dependentiae bacterium]
MSLFIIVLFLIFQFFVPYKVNVGTFFSSKVEFKMKPEMIKKVVLKNGMTVLVFKDTAVPKVLLQIAYDVGSWVEQEGEKGLAHLIEHMIFKGTDKMSENDIAAIARKYGVDFNAFTAKDITSYYFEVTKNNWQPFMGILADCMQNARFEQEHLASELKAVIQELKMYKDHYWNVMLERASTIIYPSHHSYHCPIIGFKEDLISISAENLKRFYKKHYRPERAILFIVGDVDVDLAIDQARKDFENIKMDSDQDLFTQEELKQERFPLLQQDMITNSTKIYENVQKEQMGLYWKIPGLKEKNDVLVSVLKFVLAGGEGSRLYRRLVDEEKVAFSVGAFTDHLVESGLFLILLEPVEGKSQDCVRIIKEEIEKLIKYGVDKFELSKVVRTKGREFFQRLQRLQSFVYEWIRSYVATKDEFDIFNRIEMFNKIDSHHIQEFAAKYLDPFFMNEIQLLPLPKSKKDLWLKLRKESDLFDFEILKKHQRTTPLEEPRFVKELPAPKSIEFSYPKPDKQFVLDNGLQIILKKNDQWPILTFNCGFKHSPFFAEAKEGLVVDLMMSNLVEGTKGYNKKDNVDFFESSGTSYSFDAAGASLSLLNSDYKKIFERFFTILARPSFPTKALEKLKNIYVDLFLRRKDSSIDVAIRLLKNLVYKNHPFHWTFDDAINLINETDKQDLQLLHQKYVNPQNMIVTVVGDFDLDEMHKTIKEIFEQWEGDQYQEIDYPEVEFKPQNINHVMLRDQVVLLMGRPNSINVYNPDLIPVKVLDFIAFDSLGSRLYELREKTGLFYSAFGMFAAAATREHGFDYLGSILSPESVGRSEKLLLDVIDAIGKNGVLKDELDAAKQIYLKGLIDLTTTNETVAAMFDRLQAFELGFDYYDNVLSRVQNMELTELNKIAKKYFVSSGMATDKVLVKISNFIESLPPQTISKYGYIITAIFENKNIPNN